MRLLDLFCGAGGCAVGYHRAGFTEITGIDIRPQPNYPFTFVQGDATDPNIDFEMFDAIHASPPCQGFTTLQSMWNSQEHPDLLTPTRELLESVGLPYVIENVPGAPMRPTIMLCGSTFGLDVRRHRLFETNFPLWNQPCLHVIQPPRWPSGDKRRPGVLSRTVPVYGNAHFEGDNHELRSKAMGIDWMTPDELKEAIPPAFTEYIGQQLLDQMKVSA